MASTENALRILTTVQILNMMFEQVYLFYKCFSINLLNITKVHNIFYFLLRSFFFKYSLSVSISIALIIILDSIYFKLSMIISGTV